MDYAFSMGFVMYFIEMKKLWNTLKHFMDSIHGAETYAAQIF